MQMIASTVLLLLILSPGYAIANSYEKASEAYADELSGMFNRGEITWEEAERRANEFDARWTTDQSQRQQNLMAVASAMQVFNNAQQQARRNSRPAQIIKGSETYDVYTPGEGNKVVTVRKRGQVIYGN